MAIKGIGAAVEMGSGSLKILILTKRLRRPKSQQQQGEVDASVCATSAVEVIGRGADANGRRLIMHDVRRYDGAMPA
jgi:hypothetical protein